MKRLNHFKSYVLYFVLVVVFFSCNNQKSNEPKFYTWQTSIELRYSDNIKDTIFNEIELRDTDQLKFKIKASEPTFFGAEKIVPCLVMLTHWKEEILASDVKTFRILTQTKH